MRQGKDYNKPSFKKQNKVVAFVKDTNLPPPLRNFNRHLLEYDNKTIS